MIIPTFTREQGAISRRFQELLSQYKVYQLRSQFTGYLLKALVKRHPESCVPKLWIYPAKAVDKLSSWHIELFVVAKDWWTELSYNHLKDFPRPVQKVKVIFERALHVSNSSQQKIVLPYISQGILNKSKRKCRKPLNFEFLIFGCNSAISSINAF